MKIINAEKYTTLPLGKQGENLATRICFPTAHWRETYGEGTFVLLAQRKSDAAPYPVSITADESCVYWDVSDSDTAIDGIGQCELQYIVGDVLAKSQTWVTRVAPALSAAGPDPPEPYQSWVDAILEAGMRAESAAERAETAAIRQPIIGENGNWQTWDAEAGAYTDTGVPASGGGALPAYEGVYEVTPRAGADVTLKTAQTYLDRDIVVREIPYAEVSNPAGGVTVTIGG